MGKVYSLLMRPIRTFNIENRARKIISREKPFTAPQYPSTEKQKQLSDKVNPNFLKDHYRKNIQLDQRLKDVFVTSTDSQVTIPAIKPKPLPQDRYSSDDLMFEFYDPALIPEGKCSMKQVLTFLSQHKRDSTTYTSANIAVEHKLDKKVVDDILKHFKLFSVRDDSEFLVEESNQKSLDRKYQDKNIEIKK